MQRIGEGPRTVATYTYWYAPDAGAVPAQQKPHGGISQGVKKLACSTVHIDDPAHEPHAVAVVGIPGAVHRAQGLDRVMRGPVPTVDRDAPRYTQEPIGEYKIFLVAGGERVLWRSSQGPLFRDQRIVSHEVCGASHLLARWQRLRGELEVGRFVNRIDQARRRQLGIKLGGDVKGCGQSHGHDQ